MSETSDKKFTRREIISAGAIGLTSLAISGDAAAQIQSSELEGDKADSNGKFKGKVVLITGATSGIGEGTTYAFTREGAKVFFCGRRENLGKQVETKVKSFGGEATFMRADVRREDDVKNFVDACVKKYGRVDVAFNNAGIFMTPAEIQDIPAENFLDLLQTNVMGEFFAMKYEIPQMRRQGSGVIINMASVAGHVGFPNTAHYNASKHGIIGMTKAAALANAKHKIRINSISPLAVDTPQLRESFAYQKVNAQEAAKTFVTPRIMSVDEIARAVMFLASDDASSVTGMDLDVTGGELAK